MVFQSYALYPHLTVAGNIGFGLRRSRPRNLMQQLQDSLHQGSRGLPRRLQVPSKREQRIEARIAEVAATLELEPLLDRLPKELSGGQKQRVAIARALAAKPQLLLADEPTAALDSQSGREVVDLLKDLARQQGCGVLMVTHDPRILDVADRLLQMEDGRLFAKTV
jgi:multiple sugar transport system ATP-binding protein